MGYMSDCIYKKIIESKQINTEIPSVSRAELIEIIKRFRIPSRDLSKLIDEMKKDGYKVNIKWR